MRFIANDFFLIVIVCVIGEANVGVDEAFDEKGCHCDMSAEDLPTCAEDRHQSSEV